MLGANSHAHLGHFFNLTLPPTVATEKRRNSGFLSKCRTAHIGGAVRSLRLIFTPVVPPLRISKLKPSGGRVHLFQLHSGGLPLLVLVPRSSTCEVVYDLTPVTHLTSIYFQANDSARPDGRACIGLAIMLCVRHPSHYAVYPIPAHSKSTTLTSKQTLPFMVRAYFHSTSTCNSYILAPLVPAHFPQQTRVTSGLHSVTYLRWVSLSGRHSPSGPVPRTAVPPPA